MQFRPKENRYFFTLEQMESSNNWQISGGKMHVTVPRKEYFT